MEEILGVPIVVENRAGAASLNARTAMLEDGTDGYAFQSVSTEHTAAFAIDREPFNIEELQFIGGILPQERVLFASSAAPFSTLEEMWEYGQSNPVTFANAGPWPLRVVQGMAKVKGIELRIVPFNSGADASAALLGGHVMMAETGVGTSLWSAAKGGDNVKILATLSDVENPLAPLGMPEVRSLGQAGIENTAKVYFGFAAPADAPADRVQMIADAMEQAVKDPDTVEQFAKFDLVATWAPADELAAMHADVASKVESLGDLLAE
jgi:tripartite-type tricarboxylate transporter receptor subunit TctC